jgi:hypothetical protein
VHREQMPDALFFDCDRPDQLAQHIEDVLIGRLGADINFTAQQSVNEERLYNYGKNYIDILKKAVGLDRDS